MKTLIKCLIFILPVLSIAQNFQYEPGSIPVTAHGHELQIPFNGGYNLLSVALADLDDDGDYDMLLNGGDENRLQYYKNYTLDSIPDFVLEDSWLNGIEFSAVQNRLTLEDIDFDGDMDLFVGETGGKLRYYRNDGGVQNPDFIEISAFLDSIDIGAQAAPTFGDLNGDGLNDLIIGTYNSGFMYYQRIDSSTFHFNLIDTLKNGSGEILKPGSIFHLPTLADIDDDGDLDLFGSSSESRIAFYRNTGDSAAPQFELEDAFFIEPPQWRSFITPVWIDFDFDLDLDLFYGSNHGSLSFYRNNGTQFESDFSIVTENVQLDFLDLGFYVLPSLVDIDDDGDQDLFAAADNGEFHFLRNTGTAINPEFEWITNKFASIFVDDVFAPVWGDLNNDNAFDLLYSQRNGPIFHFENNGTPMNAELDSVGILVDTNGVNIPGIRPELADIDDDGDLDLFVRQRKGQEDVIVLYQNFGTADSMAFAFSDTLRHLTGDVISYFDIFFRIADLAGDDTLDLFIGVSDGWIWHFKYLGSPDNPVFDQIQILENIFTDSRNIPFVSDIDADDDLDVFAGRFHGGFKFYRNVTTNAIANSEESIPRQFKLQQNSPNPFNPLTEIRFFLPQAALTKLDVYNIQGAKVQTVVAENLQPGLHTYSFDGAGLSTGVYFYRISAGDYQQTKKMILLK